MGTYDEEEGAAEVATPIDFFDFFSVAYLSAFFLQEGSLVSIQPGDDRSVV